MDNNLCIKIADEISDKLILLCQNNKTENKGVIELYNELLDDKYKKYRNDILLYIPGRLAAKGYEIVNSNNFQLKKY